MQIQPESSNEAILDELGKRLARHRLNLNLTQEELANEAGTGINTVYRIEQGHSTQLSNFIRVLHALGLISNLEVLVPEPPVSPIEQLRQKGQERKRASQRKVETSSTGWKWGDEA